MRRFSRAIAAQCPRKRGQASHRTILAFNSSHPAEGRRFVFPIPILKFPDPYNRDHRNFRRPAAEIQPKHCLRIEPWRAYLINRHRFLPKSITFEEFLP
jgi:hypothetical protein